MSAYLKFQRLLAGLALVAWTPNPGEAQTPGADPLEWTSSSPVPGESWVSIGTHNGVTVLGGLSGDIYYSNDLTTWNKAQRPGYGPMLNCISTAHGGFIGVADTMILMSEDGANWMSYAVDNVGVTQIAVSEWAQQWALTQASNESAWFINDVSNPFVNYYDTRTLFLPEFTQGSALNLIKTFLHEFQLNTDGSVIGVGEYEHREPIDETEMESFIRGWIANFPSLNDTDEVPDPQSIYLTSGPLYSLASNREIFLVVGAELESRSAISNIDHIGPDRAILGGKIYRSENAKDWEEVQVEAEEIPVFKEIAYHNQRFVAVGQDGKIWSTSDGLTWETQTRIEEETDFQAIGYSNGTWLAAGIDGVLAVASETPIPPEIPTVTIWSEGYAEEGVESQKATVYWTSDLPLDLSLGEDLEFETDEAVATINLIENPENNSMAVLEYVAVYDQIMEGDQFLDVQLSSESDQYQVGWPSKVRVRIQDSATDRWRQRVFQDNGIEQRTADQDDYDEDGFSNLVERFFGTNPFAPTPADEFKINWNIKDGSRVLATQVFNEIQDLNIYLEFSENGVDWESYQLGYRESEGDASQDTGIRKEIYWRLSFENNKAYFIRLSAERR